MVLKTMIFVSETLSTVCSFLFNFTLLYLIQKKTNEELRPYSKILRTNSFVDMFFTLVIGLTYLKVNINGEYIILNGGPLRNIPMPWNGYLLLLYIFALYFCLSSTAIPSGYRYVLFCRSQKLTNTQFYLLYILTGVLSMGVAVWVKLAVWPSVENFNITKEFYHSFDDEFWREDDGSIPIFMASHLKNPFLIATLLHALCLITIAYSFIIFFTIKTWKHLNKFKAQMSEKTRKLQRQLTYTLALAPLVVGAFPLAMCIISLLFGLGIPYIGVTLISLVSWVAVLNPLCVIVFVGPYRDAILRKKIQIIVPGATHSSNWGLSNNISVNVVL